MIPVNTPFDKSILPGIVRSFYKQLPREACGFVVNDTYIPCENISTSDDHFKISPHDYLAASEKGEIQCVLHSHNNWPHASKVDMQQQAAMDTPWGVINFRKGNVEDVFFWGDSVEPLPMVGRRFNHGVHDCFSLVRDWWRMKGVTIPDSPREWGWWLNSEEHEVENVIVEGLEYCGWYIIDLKDIEPGDGLLFRVRYKTVNHCAVYVGNGLMLHHFCAPGVLSRHDPIGPWEKRFQYAVRLGRSEET